MCTGCTLFKFVHISVVPFLRVQTSMWALLLLLWLAHNAMIYAQCVFNGEPPIAHWPLTTETQAQDVEGGHNGVFFNGASIVNDCGERGSTQW